MNGRRRTRGTTATRTGHSGKRGTIRCVSSNESLIIRYDILIHEKGIGFTAWISDEARRGLPDRKHVEKLISKIGDDEQCSRTELRRLR